MSNQLSKLPVNINHNEEGKVLIYWLTLYLAKYPDEESKLGFNQNVEEISPKVGLHSNSRINIR